MHHAQLPRQVLVLAKARRVAAASRSPIRRTCLAATVRHASTDTTDNSAQGWFRRLRNSVFGTKESKEAEQRREQAQVDRTRSLAEAAEQAKIENPDEGLKLERTISKRGKRYEIARAFDPDVNKEYKPADTWEGLDRQGSEEWVRKLRDTGEKYQGWSKTAKRLSNQDWQDTLHRLAVKVFAEHQITLRGERTQTSKQRARADQDAASDQPAWMKSRVTEPAVKFAIWRALIHETGVRPAEYFLSKATKLADIYAAFSTDRAPKRVHATLNALGTDERPPNLNIRRYKTSWVDKERSIGRLKQIELELSLRELPLPGEKTQHTNMKEGSQVYSKS